MKAKIEQNKTEKEVKTPYAEMSAAERANSQKSSCNCGTEIKEVGRKAKVHSWRPPCSCGVNLADVV